MDRRHCKEREMSEDEKGRNRSCNWKCLEEACIQHWNFLADDDDDYEYTIVNSCSFHVNRLPFILPKPESQRKNLIILARIHLICEIMSDSHKCSGNEMLSLAGSHEDSKDKPVVVH